jgi:N-acetylglucosaminyl-diphospho-decaprenol L-rhamnosyltransferase
VGARTVAVVVITYNSADDLPSCLASLSQGGADGVQLTDVVIVDNASSDSSVQIAKATDDLPISIVQMVENVGYAAGVNAGIDSLRGRPPEAVMILNPDCRLRPGALATLADALQVPGRGVVAPLLLNPDGTLQPSLRRVPTVTGALVESVLGGRIADRLGVGELIFAEGPHARAGATPWVTGAALLMDWALLESVGPWDESFLLYSEETEFLLRASDHGWSTWFDPAAVVDHKGGESATMPSLFALLTVNRAVLFEKRYGKTRGRAYAACLLLGMLIRAATGKRTARAAAVALLRPSRRITALAQLH